MCGIDVARLHFILSDSFDKSVEFRQVGGYDSLFQRTELVGRCAHREPSNGTKARSAFYWNLPNSGLRKEPNGR